MANGKVSERNGASFAPPASTRRVATVAAVGVIICALTGCVSDNGKDTDAFVRDELTRRGVAQPGGTQPHASNKEQSNVRF